MASYRRSRNASEVVRGGGQQAAMPASGWLGFWTGYLLALFVVVVFDAGTAGGGRPRRGRRRS